jgi:phytoene dehydrogenase-like protein
MTSWDAVVVGGGHNGLTTAATLARAGLRVAVVERRHLLGGLCAAEEFAPGFRSGGLLHDSALVRESVVELLDLRRHGLTLRSQGLAICCPDAEGGPGLVLSRDPAQRRLGDQEERYRAWRAFIEKVTPVMTRLLNSAPPEFRGESPADLLKVASTGLAVRTLGADAMMGLLRTASLPARDWLEEWFGESALQGALALPGLEGAYMGPWSPGSAGLLLMREALEGGGVRGGPAALVQALVSAAEALGVTLMTQAEVAEVSVRDGAVRGVALKDGRVLEAPVVALACDPRAGLLGLVPSRHLPLQTADALRHWRVRGIQGKVHLALRGAPRLAGQGERRFARFRVAPSLEALERAFDAVKYGTYSENMALDVMVPTVENPLLAPEGHHVASVMVSFVPYEHREGWDEARRAALGDQVVELLSRYAPGLKDQVVAREVLTPADLEARYGLSGGHLYHGEHAMDQLSLMRPAPDCAHYQTPIGGLYLCGAGAHPGGGVSCAPGALAAAAILKQRQGT